MLRNDARLAVRPLGSFGAALALGASLAVATAVASPHTFNSTCLPPSNSQYTATFHQLYAAGLIDLRNPIHQDFTSCSPPPPLLGGQTLHNFNSAVRFDISTNGGLTYQPYQAPAQVSVSVRNIGMVGGTTLYDTEMLQLDISGGTLPPGVMVRESPTRASTGRTTIQPSGGNFLIDSFFDIFTELSLDGGQTWMPSEGPPGHVVMDVLNPTPTNDSTWGKIKALYRH